MPKPALIIPKCPNCDGKFVQPTYNSIEFYASWNPPSYPCQTCNGYGYFYKQATLDGRPFLDNEDYKWCKECNAIMEKKLGDLYEYWECMHCDFMEVEY
jgi:hypothetical protein